MISREVNRDTILDSDVSTSNSETNFISGHGLRVRGQSVRTQHIISAVIPWRHLEKYSPRKPKVSNILKN